MSPRLPGRHDQPVTPLEMSDAAIVQFGREIETGYDGAAPWRRNCVCHHRTSEHHPAGPCTKCSCQRLRIATDHEELVITLPPDMVNYLPPGTYVISVSPRLEVIGDDGRGGTVQGYRYLLGRDFDSSTVKVVRSGVRKDTDRYVEPREGGDE